MNKFGEVSGDGELEIHKNTVIQVRNPIAIHVLKYFHPCGLLAVASEQFNLICIL